MTARNLLPVVGIARSTYHYQLNAMKRPDKDASLLELVREAFENSERRYGYKRIHLELKGMGVRVSAKRVMRLMTSMAWCRCSRARSGTARTRAS
ncbi:IS3 family transposase [Bifidobacterium dentium]|uniref:IS3 family transposase n=1 Tax=Bifidobacterium dentium TaxID=1689 RepID=UPI003D180DED